MIAKYRMRDLITLIEQASRPVLKESPGWRFITSCVNSDADSIIDMQDSAIEVSYATLVRHVGRDNLMYVFPQYDWSPGSRGLTLKGDCAVSFYRSRYRGEPCYYVEQSRIEHVFAQRNPD